MTYKALTTLFDSFIIYIAIFSCIAVSKTDSDYNDNTTIRKLNVLNTIHDIQVSGASLFCVMHPVFIGFYDDIIITIGLLLHYSTHLHQKAM